MSSTTLPKRVLIIRHAEKPGDPGEGDPIDGPNLSTRSYERAGALAPYVPAQFGRPDFLFAAQATANSNRPVETITPLSKAIGVEISSRHADKDYGKVAAEILGNVKYAGKLVLICWHHGRIQDLASALGAKQPISKWPGSVFDRVWEISYPTDGSAAKNLPAQDHPQRLLYGDSPT
jgi:phosphohistidine phosphatase SixA